MPFQSDLVALFLIMYSDRVQELTAWKQNRIVGMLFNPAWTDAILAKMMEDATDDDTIGQVFRLRRKWEALQQLVY